MGKKGDCYGEVHRKGYTFIGGSVRVKDAKTLTGRSLLNQLSQEKTKEASCQGGVEGGRG